MTTDQSIDAAKHQREVIGQARECLQSSWEECDEATKLETRALTKSERRTLKRHLNAACPEIQFLDVIEIVSPSRISLMVSNNSMSLDLTEGWNLFCREDRLKAWRYICYFKHIVVILSPECKDVRRSN